MAEASALNIFIKDKAALELIGYFWSQGTRITGLYEIHGPINGATGLQWYIGPGAHIGFYNTKYGDGAFIGVDGVYWVLITNSGERRLISRLTGSPLLNLVITVDLRAAGADWVSVSILIKE